MLCVFKWHSIISTQLLFQLNHYSHIPLLTLSSAKILKPAQVGHGNFVAHKFQNLIHWHLNTCFPILVCTHSLTHSKMFDQSFLSLRPLSQLTTPFSYNGWPNIHHFMYIYSGKHFNEHACIYIYTHPTDLSSLFKSLIEFVKENIDQYQLPMLIGQWGY